MNLFGLHAIFTGSDWFGQGLKGQVLKVLGDKLKVSVDQMDIKNGFIVFKGETPDFSALRTIYAKEHRGFSDNPDSRMSRT